MTDLSEYRALDPFFDVVLRGLHGLVDGEHFFDLFTDDSVIEFVVTVPDYPRRVDGRTDLMDLYRGYGDTIQLTDAGELAVYHDREASVVVLEYSVQGNLVGTGAPYRNRFVSIITVRDRKIARWRDYLDSLAVIQALGDQVPVS